MIPDIHYTSRDKSLNLDLYNNFLSEDEANNLYDEIESNIEWGKTKNYKRLNRTFGDINLSYEIKWYGKTTVRKALGWPEYLIPIKEKIEELTNQKYNICVLQRYPKGYIGINPHRDKEMTPNTTICGLSLNQKRILRMGRRNINVDIPLENGSLYIFNPPTNDWWSHSILKDDSKQPRISLTFRNYDSFKENKLI